MGRGLLSDRVAAWERGCYFGDSPGCVVAGVSPGCAGATLPLVRGPMPNSQESMRVVRPTNGPVNANGNDVDLETESTGLVRDGLQYDALVQATNYRLNVLRAAVR